VDLDAFHDPGPPPASHFYDVLAGTSEGLGLLVAEVSGPAGTLASAKAKIRGAVHCFVPIHPSPADLLDRAARVLRHALPGECAVSLAYARLLPLERSLTISAAGTIPVFLWRSATRIAYQIGRSNPSLNCASLKSPGPIQEETFPFDVGDRLLLCSPGLQRLQDGPDHEGASPIVLTAHRAADSTSSEFLGSLLQSVYPRDKSGSVNLTLLTARLTA